MGESYYVAKERLIANEQDVLRALAFDVGQFQPHKWLLNFCRSCRCSARVTQQACAVLNDMCVPCGGGLSAELVRRIVWVAHMALLTLYGGAVEDWLFVRLSAAAGSLELSTLGHSPSLMCRIARHPAEQPVPAAVGGCRFPLADERTLLRSSFCLSTFAYSPHQRVVELGFRLVSRPFATAFP